MTDLELPMHKIDTFLTASWCRRVLFSSTSWRTIVIQTLVAAATVSFNLVFGRLSTTHRGTAAGVRCTSVMCAHCRTGFYTSTVTRLRGSGGAEGTIGVQ